MSRNRFRMKFYVCVLFTVLFVILCRPAAAQSQTHNITLSLAETSIDPNGRLVVTMIAGGDLQGVLTLGLDRDATGTVTGGEWALVVSYTIKLGGVGSVEDPDGGEGLVQKGVVKGQIQGGTITTNGSGSITALNGILLALNGGTLEYAGTTTGSGAFNGSGLENRETSSGVMSLIF